LDLKHILHAAEAISNCGGIDQIGMVIMVHINKHESRRRRYFATVLALPNVQRRGGAEVAVTASEEHGEGDRPMRGLRFCGEHDHIEIALASKIAEHKLPHVGDIEVKWNRGPERAVPFAERSTEEPAT
jgi:hypothetical protein